MAIQDPSKVLEQVQAAAARAGKVQAAVAAASAAQRATDAVLAGTVAPLAPVPAPSPGQIKR